jgi:serine/threonine protein phosphatase PrpC
MLLDVALERGGSDNVTVIVVRSLPAVARSSEPTNSPVMDVRGVLRR